ncbi:hypothetical protein PG999_003970 [Apiospora kogelbergensis]|uniref:Heterokaryon incompatibility domain-containing protein n=1 Tax=Apiospora kogelbergensis TaxID=1337665 RepID=A0AAW0R5A7_9PEZI
MEVKLEGLPYTYHVLDGSIWSNEVDSGPLNQRGWVFQERHLARRVLYFGKTQMAWGCKEKRALEMFPTGIPSCSIQPDREFDLMGNMTQATSNITPLGLPGFVKDWQDLLEDYSTCEFSFPRDKLMALEGISTQLAIARPGDSYFAGAWKSTALFDLPWHRHQDDRDEYPATDTSERAPSWSWACVDGAIQFPLAQEVFPRVRECYAQVKTLAGHSVTIGDNVRTVGSIQMEASCLPLRLQLSEQNDIIGFYGPGFRFSTTNGPLQSAIYLECADQVACLLSNAGKLLLIPLFSTVNFIYCIVVWKIRGVSEHRRVGAVNIALMELTDEETRGTRDILQQDIDHPLPGMLPDNLSEKWNLPALRLVLSLKQKPLFRCVNIS